MKASGLGVVVLGLLVFSGCGDGGDQAATPARQTGGPLNVLTVNYPLAYFAERIGGEHVTATYPGPADEDPAFWNPSPDAVTAYQAADLILLNGATYAKWLAKVTLPAAKLVDTSAGFADRYITVEDAVTHAHGPGGEHAHTGTAFTTRLDFTQAVAQAAAVREAFTAARPGQTPVFSENFVALERDLLALDRRLTELVADEADRPLVASHPVYQYLARRYGLDLESVMWEPGVLPSDRDWEALHRGLEAHPARWMIWEDEPLAESARRLADLGVTSLIFDPCATPPDEGDFLEVMRANITAMAVAYR